MSNSLEKEFMSIEEKLKEDMEKYKELCDRMGFNFEYYLDDIIDQINSMH